MSAADRRDPTITNVNVHDVAREHVEVFDVDGTTWLKLGPVSFFATPDELVAIGNEIARQATEVRS